MKSRLNQFNKIAPIYNLLSQLVFGGTLKKAQRFFLSELPKQGNILIIGGGDGWIANEILSMSNSTTIVYIEASDAMLTRARKKLINYKNRIQFIHGTETCIPEGSVYDVVVTNFYLDLFSDSTLTSVIGHINKFKQKNGVWLVTEFVDQNKWWQHSLLWLMYKFFNITCGIQAEKLPDWQQHLQKKGLQEIKSFKFYNGFVSTSLFKCSL